VAVKRGWSIEPPTKPSGWRERDLAPHSGRLADGCGTRRRYGKRDPPGDAEAEITRLRKLLGPTADAKRNATRLRVQRYRERQKDQASAS
jgi:hypothetical protein